jgi:hypothetical protein
MTKVPITLDGIMSEFQVMQSLYERGYVDPDGYEKYKKACAVRLIDAYNKIEKNPWWKIW